VTVPLADGLLADFSADPLPTSVFGWGCENRELELGGNATHFGFVFGGDAILTTEHLNFSREFSLGSGMYFSASGGAKLNGGTGVVVSRIGYRGVFLIGGPVEATGRLRYIDGCTASLLVPPVTKGDPCLNFLHFPPHVEQTLHTHPSLRICLVVRGRGRCTVPADPAGTGGEITLPLVPGRVMVIPADGPHRYCTDDESMDLISYHPDSDTGPEHQNHPVLNRTIVKGVSAAQLPNICNPIKGDQVISPVSGKRDH